MYVVITGPKDTCWSSGFCIVCLFASSIITSCLCFFAHSYKKEVNEASFFNMKTFIIQPIGHKAFGFHGTLTVLFFKRGKS